MTGLSLGLVFQNKMGFKKKKKNKEMRFLVTDIGHEEVLLGYPWLATFEPKFQWKSTVIDERTLPIIISSINPRSIKQQPIIATGLSEDAKQSIVRQLETECHV
jgi:hypothetical protein